VMKMLADTRGIRIKDTDKKELTDKFSTMPAHPEVPAALDKLRGAGFRLFTLTDNMLDVQTRQLEHAGIIGMFERRFSADGIKRHKPAREAYGYVERELEARPSQLCLIACHTWDTLGAVASGWEAALIRRVGNDVLAVGPSHKSSATISTTSPINSSPGTARNSVRHGPDVRCKQREGAKVVDQRSRDRPRARGLG
jgi:2-haloacid dehalogenase